jgi:tetratricopeptide (TPR) repeat protein
MASDLPTVSVIVRSMARPTLAAALESLMAQSDVSLEVLVIAASGPSHPALEAPSGPHPVRLLAGDAPLSRPAAANAGLEAARGAWITFLDDDDRFLPGHLAGLLAAAQKSGAQVITSYARCVFADGRVESFGQPFSLAQLYERNFIHLSTALVSRALLDGGHRFDVSFPILEDWDFMLQLAQVARFHFVPLRTFEWHPDAGDSGASGGDNHDDARFATQRDRLYEKWSHAHDALVDRTAPLLAQAGSLARAGQLREADVVLDQVFAISPNDPWALNLSAMLLRQAGDLPGAREMQSLAVSVRPQDAGFLFNLALLDRAAGDLAVARIHAARALERDPELAPARTLLAQLG